MNAYSASQFKNVSPEMAEVIVNEDFLQHTDQGEFCLVENKEILSFFDKIEEFGYAVGTENIRLISN